MTALPRFVDLSIYLENDVLSDPPPLAPKITYQKHKAGRDIGDCRLEKLHNLEALPGDGFTVCCFPHKIRGASAGWTRAVAIFQD